MVVPIIDNVQNPIIEIEKVFISRSSTLVCKKNVLILFAKICKQLLIICQHVGSQKIRILDA